MWISSYMDYHINCILIQDNFWVERQIQKPGGRNKAKKWYLDSPTYSLTRAHQTILRERNNYCQMVYLNLQVSLVFISMVPRSRHIYESKKSWCKRISVKAEWNFTVRSAWSIYLNKGHITKVTASIIGFQILPMNIGKSRSEKT